MLVYRQNRCPFSRCNTSYKQFSNCPLSSNITYSSHTSYNNSRSRSSKPSRSYCSHRQQRQLSLSNSFSKCSSRRPLPWLLHRQLQLPMRQPSQKTSSYSNPHQRQPWRCNSRSNSSSNHTQSWQRLRHNRLLCLPPPQYCRQVQQLAPLWLPTMLSAPHPHQQQQQMRAWSVGPMYRWPLIGSTCRRMRSTLRSAFPRRLSSWTLSARRWQGEVCSQPMLKHRPAWSRTSITSNNVKTAPELHKSKSLIWQTTLASTVKCFQIWYTFYLTLKS